MTGEPPSGVGASHANVTEVSVLAVVLRNQGVEGAPAGVNEVDALEAAPFPTAFTARSFSV